MESREGSSENDTVQVGMSDHMPLLSTSVLFLLQTNLAEKLRMEFAALFSDTIQVIAAQVYECQEENTETDMYAICFCAACTQRLALCDVSMGRQH